MLVGLLRCAGLPIVLALSLAGHVHAAETTHHNTEPTAGGRQHPGRIDNVAEKSSEIQVAAAIGIVKPGAEKNGEADTPAASPVENASPRQETREGDIAQTDEQAGEVKSASRFSYLVGAGIAAVLGVVAGGAGGSSSSSTSHH